MKYSARLRKVGKSVMLVLPSAVLKKLNLAPGALVDLSVRGKGLVIGPPPRPVHTLHQLLSEGRKAKNLRVKDQAWLNAPRIGREII